MPILELLIRQLVKQRIFDITLTLGYQAELIRAYFGQHRSLASQLNLTMVDEESPSGTAGSLSNISDLNETFLVLNGDLLTNINFYATCGIP